MTTEISIKRATVDDIAVLVPLIKASQLFQQKELEGRELFDESRFVKDLESNAASWLDSPDKAYFVAFDGEGKPLGYIFGMVDNVTDRIGSISDLYVIPEARTSGVGGGLLDQASKWMQREGMKKIVLAVHENNPALSFYRHRGFTPRHDPYILLEKEVAPEVQ